MLQYLVGTIYFLNKVLLALGKRSGWVIGVIAAILAILYYLTLDLYTLITLEAGFLALMIFGWFNHARELRADRFIYPLMIVVMAYLLWSGATEGPLELVISLTFMIAIYDLAKHRWQRGWIFMGLAHGLMAWLAFRELQYFFGSAQVLSAGVAVYALLRKTKGSVLQ